MTELKTLKDVQITEAKIMQVNTAHYGHICLALRDEAIKWIKTPDMELWDFLEDMIPDGCVHDIYMLKIGLKKFFNIIESEIKDA